MNADKPGDLYKYLNQSYDYLKNEIKNNEEYHRILLNKNI